ncbi:unnamed protein product, partial [Tetraodon nigroviridis]
VDIDLLNEQRSQRDFDPEKTLSLLRENCEQGLLKEDVQAPQVFLLSNFELQHHDFLRLHETLERDLPEHRRDALLYAMLNINLEIIETKKEKLKSKTVSYASFSAAGAWVPIPGLSVAVDVGLIACFAQQYKTGFGLDTPSLQRLAESAGAPLNDLTSVVRSPLNLSDINAEFISNLRSQTGSFASSIIAEEALRLTPLPQLYKAYNRTEKALLDFLNMLAEDAQNVFKIALCAIKPSVSTTGK